MAKPNGVSKEALADLARSGLSSADAKVLKVKSLDAEKTAEALGIESLRYPSYQLPYFNVRGETTGFFRVRFLADVTKSSGVRGRPRAKPIRYGQPANTAPQAYFPPLGVDWAKIVADPSRPILITEGEKKAAKACKEGLACIGLGGVWNFRSARFAKELIDDLAEIVWDDRDVLILFDSDPKPKPEVDGAAEECGRTLERRGACVKRIELPINGTGAKVGLDDYLVEHSVAELRALPRKELFSTTTLAAFNEQVAVIASPPCIITFDDMSLHRSPRSLTDIKFASHKMMRVEASGQLKQVSAFTEWLAWPKRRQHSSIVYEPGKPPVTKDNALNLWNGWGIEPKAGDISPWEKLMDFVFHGDAAGRKWFLQWAAYPLQHPGAKLFTAVVLWSCETGTGKTLTGSTLARIYGEANSKEIGEEHLHGSFNDWRANKQFILGEEVTGSDRRAEADRLKRVITGERVLINKKFEQAYEVRDCANYLFTTNHPDAFLVDAADRRYFIHEVGLGGEKPPETWFTHEYDTWFRSTEGAAALFHHLLRVKLDGFDPRGRAPKTASREAMVHLSGNEHDVIARELIAAPDKFLRLGETPITRDLFTISEVVKLCDPDSRRLLISGMGRALARLGVKSMNVRVPSLGVLRLVPLRNVKKWQEAPHAELVAHYIGAQAPKPAKM